MKLLLTSSGIRNKELAKELERLLGKPAAETKVGFVSTAANVEPGNKLNKYWFVRQLFELDTHGYSWIDVIDIAAPGVDWQSRLAVVDVIVVGGGNTFYLLHHARLQGFDTWLRDNVAEKVYLGISAGSILVTPDIAVAGIEPGDENIVGVTDTTGVGLVDFEVSPHSPEPVSYQANERYAQTTENTLYCVDEETAVSYEGAELRIIGPGEHRIFN